MQDAHQWLELAADVLTDDDADAGRARLMAHLVAEFDASTVARIDLDRRQETLRTVAFPVAADGGHRRAGEVRTLLETHPLLLHYAATGSLEPMVTLRPDESPRTLPAPLITLLRAWGVSVHQLTLPVRSEARRRLEAYVLVRDDPFPRWALPRARALHDLVRGLDRHLHLLACADEAEPEVSDVIGLTPRERTILLLLAESRTAESIGRALGISVRTVHKHLENVYRKLDVSDRVAAVTAARRRGIVGSSRD